MEAILDYRGKTPPKTRTGIPLITAKVVKGGRIEAPDEFIAPSEYDSWMRRGLPKAGDVLLTTEAPLGEVAPIVDPKVALAQRLIALRGKQGELSNVFLRYLMQSEFVQEQLKARATGTTVVGIKQSELRRVLLPVPGPAEQDAIGGILLALDDKIESNLQMNQLLEGIARAIFKAWFVDFEPVKAKAAGAAGFPGMSKDVFNQLSGRFVDSELGEIPDGWSVGTLDTLFEINPSRSLRKGELAPYLEMADMPTNGHAPERWVNRAVGSGMRFTNGDTLVARITPCLENGKTAFVDFLPEDAVGWGSTEYIVLRPRAPFPEIYAYCLARSTGFRDFAISNMTGTSGRQRVPATVLSHFSIVQPDLDMLEYFGMCATPLFAAVAASMNENRVLAVLRDTLLPKLITGEIPVPFSNGGSDGK